MKFSILYLLVILLISFCCMHSCTSDKGELPKPIIVVDSRYQTAIKPIIVTYCYGQGAQTCHVTVSNENASGDFTTYDGLKAKIDNGSFQTRVLNPGADMPPPNSTGPKVIAPADLEKLKTWISSGAPNN